MEKQNRVTQHEPVRKVKNLSSELRWNLQGYKDVLEVGRALNQQREGGQRMGLCDNPYSDMQIMYHWFLCHCSWSDIPRKSKYHINRQFDNADMGMME